MVAISGSLTLLTNLVIAWNTQRMQATVNDWRHKGRQVDDEWLRRMGPAHFAHVNFRGTLSFPSTDTATCCWRLRPGNAARDHETGWMETDGASAPWRIDVRPMKWTSTSAISANTYLRQDRAAPPQPCSYTSPQ